MAIRKASSYSKRIARPYTRVSRNKSKAYIKQTPHNKIVKYSLGNSPGYHAGKMKYILRYISVYKVQVRDTALESARRLLIKQLEKNAPNQFYLEMKVKPHHILRNNKTAAGAGADRLSTGMKQSFGIVEGRAAIVKPGTEVLFVACENENAVKVARHALNAVKPKMPVKGRVTFEEISK